MWMRTVLYQLNMMTTNCTRFHEMWESQRPDTWDWWFLTSNATERESTRGMMPEVMYFLHIELLITGEPGLIPLGKYFLHIKLWTVESQD